MKLFMKILSSVLIFFIVLIITLPKINLWYGIEHFLNDKSKIIIDDEKISSNLIGLKLSDGKILFDNMEVAQFDNLKITPAILYNSFDFENLKTGRDVKQFDFNLDNFHIEYSVIRPTKVVFEGKGSIGEIYGRVLIFKRELNILLFPTKKMLKAIIFMKHFKKNEGNGGYLYEAKF